MAKFTRADSKMEQHYEGRAPTPNVPIRTAELRLEEWREGVRFGSRDLPLSKLGGATQIGVVLMVLGPGKQSCPFHFHLREEEHFYVLRGRSVLRTSEGRTEMATGDYACFPAGTRVAHCFENPFDEDCHVLVVGNRSPDEIAVYPDSGKMKLRALDQIVPYEPGRSLDYWEGERSDEPLGSR